MARKFDLEAAKRGEPILFAGRPAKFVAHVPEARSHQRIVVVSNSGNIYALPDNGLGPSGSEVTMAPRKQQLWGRAFLYCKIVCMRTAGTRDSLSFMDETETWLDPEPWLLREYEVDDE